MKSVLSILMIAVLTGLTSCSEGPVGPQGEQGIQGEQGPQGESGYVFEYEGVSFTSPDYEVYLSYPDDFVSYSSDVALVYMLWDVVDDLEVWRPLPQSILTGDGLLQYNFDFTMVDVRLFMDAEFDMSYLGAIDTDDWVVRVVIVPGDFWNSSRLSAGDLEYNDVKEMLGLPDLATPATVLKRRE